MQKISYPTSDTDRVVLLKRLLETAVSDRTDNRDYLPQKMVDTITAALTDFLPSYEKLAQMKQSRGQEIDERNAAATRLEIVARAFREAVIRAQQVNELAEAYPVFFEIGTEAMRGGNVYDWIEVANTYLRGEANAVAAGFPPLCNPTAVQLQAARDLAQAEASDVDKADRELDLIQQALADRRPTLDRHIRAASAQLNAALYDLPNDDIRRIKRTYGYTYAEVAAPLPGDPLTEADSI